jgi:hypothetical protein
VLLSLSLSIMNDVLLHVHVDKFEKSVICVYSRSRIGKSRTCLVDKLIAKKLIASTRIFFFVNAIDNRASTHITQVDSTAPQMCWLENFFKYRSKELTLMHTSRPIRASMKSSIGSFPIAILVSTFSLSLSPSHSPIIVLSKGH